MNTLFDTPDAPDYHITAAVVTRCRWTVLLACVRDHFGTDRPEREIHRMGPTWTRRALELIDAGYPTSELFAADRKWRLEP